VSTAVGTVSAVVVALFLALRRPKPLLKLKLLRPEGEKTLLNSGEPVRYYHLHVWNKRRDSPAEEVQVYLTRLEEPDMTRDPWLGDVPFRWRDQEFVPHRLRIGSARDCDPCMVGSDSGLRLLLPYTPNSLYTQRAGKCVLILFVQARSSHADSKVMRVKMRWNGTWADDDLEMQKHLQITCDWC
jgi:hypothetical protein